MRRSPVPQWPEVPGTEGSCCACELRIDPQKHEGRSKGGPRQAQSCRGRVWEARTPGTGPQTVWRATCRWSTLGQKHQGSVNPRRQRDGEWVARPGQVLVAASVQVRVPSRGCGPTALRLNLTQSSCQAPLCPLWGRGGVRGLQMCPGWPGVACGGSGGRPQVEAAVLAQEGWGDWHVGQVADRCAV